MKNDHHVGIRAAAGVFIPLITLVVLGRLDLAIFASFGAFTGIYARNEPHRVRLVAQSRAGVLMLAVILAATISARLSPGGAMNPWGIVIGTTLVAWGCTIIVGYWRLRPAGSLFHIFAFAAIASIPHQPPLGEAMLAATGTVALSLLIGIASRIVPRYRSTLTWAGLRAAWLVRLGAAERRALWLESLGYLVAAALAGTIATIVGQALGFGHNYWAMVAAVVPLVGHTTRHRVNRGLQRVLGTVVGLVVLAAIVAIRPEAWLMVVFIAACQFGAEMLIARQYFLAQVCVTPLALMSTLLVAHVNPLDLLHDRFIDTAIGAVVGVGVVLAPDAWRRWIRWRSREEQLEWGRARRRAPPGGGRPADGRPPLRGLSRRPRARGRGS
ncbi:FUSC family protein [Sinomonas sp. ASV486]|uniref:FUSC family protein n=1 Tax=Sinomonas sp. ASV486 TaxID=3051170 RepID=UPI0027DAE5E5|nr:FUSC family protein [Sinomonas sp. ASV486]MDQ4489299.1 FUSC family protein [Sinomonas sp. ASV486]